MAINFKYLTKYLAKKCFWTENHIILQQKIRPTRCPPRPCASYCWRYTIIPRTMDLTRVTRGIGRNSSTVFPFEERRLCSRIIPRVSLLYLPDTPWHTLQVDQAMIIMTGFECVSFQSLLQKVCTILWPLHPFQQKLYHVKGWYAKRRLSKDWIVLASLLFGCAQVGQWLLFSSFWGWATVTLVCIWGLDARWLLRHWRMIPLPLSVSLQMRTLQCTKKVWEQSIRFYLSVVHNGWPQVVSTAAMGPGNPGTFLQQLDTWSLCDICFCLLSWQDYFYCIF